MLGATIVVDNEKKHTWTDWGLKWTSIEISSPNPKTYRVDVPFSDGSIDLTEALVADVKYENRNIKLEFEVEGDYYKWEKFYSDFLNFCHGRQVKVILDTDSSFYWIGRINLSSTKDDYLYGLVSIELDADPYKYELTSSLEDWVWDSFSFETGIIREYKDLQVNSSLSVNIIGLRKVIYLKVTSSTAMQVIFNNKTYTVPKGTVELLDIPLKQGDNIITFKGNGTISIDYRGGSL